MIGYWDNTWLHGRQETEMTKNQFKYIEINYSLADSFDKLLINVADFFGISIFNHIITASKIYS